jgi:hypothetical protein
MDRPSDLEKFTETWPDAPSLPPPFELQSDPQTEFAPLFKEPPPLMPDREPFTEEWRCLVPLQDAKEGTRCETPSLEPDDLFHLL